ncbi:hypothetical protein Tco_0084489 [Tanacetum coccineum]
MGRDTIQLEGAISTISGEYLLKFTSEYGILENLHPEVLGLGETIVDFPEGKTLPNSSLTTVSDRRGQNKRIFPTAVDWRASAPREEMPIAGSYSAADVTLLNTDRAPFQRLPENLLCLVGLSQNYYLGDDVYHTFLYDDDRDLEDPVASGSPWTPSTVERSPLDFDNEDPAPSLDEGAGAEEHVQEGLAHEIPPVETVTTTKVVQEVVHEEEVAATKPPVNKRRKQMRRKRVNEEAEANASPKVLRKYHASGHTQSTRGGKFIAAMGLDAGSTFSPPAAQNTPTTVSNPEPLSYAKPQPHPMQDITQSSKGAAAKIPTEDVATTKVNVQLSMGSPNLGKSTSPSVGGSPRGIYQPGWGVTNNCRLDSPEACQDLVAMGSQLRLRFEQVVRLLKKATTKIARRDQKIHAREDEIKKLNEEIRSLRTMEIEVHGLRNRTQNLETLLEVKVDMKKSAEAKSMDLAGELESLREERIKAAFEEFKKSKDEKVEQRCAEMDARLDALIIDFDEELYPHMLTAIAGHRWVIGHGLRLAIMKCAESTELRQAFADAVSVGIVKGMSEGLKYEVEHREAKLDLAAIEAYDPEAEAKYIATLTALRDLKYALIDQLEKLRDAPIDLLMASLHLESNSGEDTPEWIRKLRPSTSQLKIPIYLEVPNPRDPWSVQEEMLLEDAIATNRSRVEKKKKAQWYAVPIGSALPTCQVDGIPSICTLDCLFKVLAHLTGGCAVQIQNASKGGISTDCLDPNLYHLCIIWIGHRTACGT